MARGTITHQLVEQHLVAGDPEPGEEIALRIDQTLCQDATGTLVMLELEALGLERARTELSVQYVDHNLLQEDHKNADDHLFLLSAARRFGLWFSRPGTGVSHPVHMERFGAPGKTLLGADSHTCAAGALGMLAIGAGGIEVALAIAGEPFHLPMPEVWGIELVGSLPPWVSAKDVILELLRRHGVRGGLGRVLEYHGPGLRGLSVMDRHVIANMGAELGATSSVFPSDAVTRAFLAAHGREADWRPLRADTGSRYDREETLDLSRLEPLIARPSSPGDVVPVREVAGVPVHQVYVGSSANPGYRDFAVVAEVLAGRTAHPQVSLDVNPSTRAVLRALTRDGHIDALLASGARLHQTGCNGCIGMGQAPPSGRNSLRTVPRNFPGRSGTREDRVWLCSPETAVASALTGRITDPRTLEREPPRIEEPRRWLPMLDLLPPLAPEAAAQVELEKGPNIAGLPPLEPLPDELAVTLLLALGDDVSTDEILPAGARVLPYRSNLPRIADFCFERLEPGYAARARALSQRGIAHAVLAGANYGQGSSREHAALAPRSLGLRLVLARSFARIHRQNLIDFGVLPLRLLEPEPAARVAPGDQLHLRDLHRLLREEGELELELDGGGRLHAAHDLSSREVEVVLAGGLIPWARERLETVRPG